MIYPSLKKTTKYIMKIGIDLIDLVPKNNQGKDIMLNSPSSISREQLEELSLKFNKP